MSGIGNSITFASIFGKLSGSESHAASLFSRCQVTLFLLLVLLVTPGFGATSAIRGTVTDSLGAVIPNAAVRLLRDSSFVAETSTNATGMFEFGSLDAGSYLVEVSSEGFSSYTSPRIFLSSDQARNLTVLLPVGSLKQEIVVSDTGTATPVAQTGASVTVIDRAQLEALNKLDVLEALRTVPGVQVVQLGQRGGASSLFIRGGESDFNKVMVDGIPVNAIGGGFDFARYGVGGVESVEVLRGANSVLYGADALGGVVNITTRRGQTRVPEFTYAVDGGNFGSLRQGASLAGAFRSFDYFSDFSRFDTRNSVPNSAFHNATYAGNFGFHPVDSTDLRLTIRQVTAKLNTPNALSLYGIPDDAFTASEETYVGGTLQNQTTSRWHNLARFAFAQFDYPRTNPTPTGTAFDPFGFGANYLGNPVTIRGANGYSVTGAAILDFGATYPDISQNYSARRSLYGQSDYQFLNNLAATFAFRYEHENGQAITRDNYTYTLQAHGDLGKLFYFTVGTGLENNAVFGFAASPRVSLAYYLRQPSSNWMGETKVKFNFGKGIKEPAIFDQTFSVFALLSPALISQTGISPVGPERSRSFDFGVEQGLWGGRARLGVTFFHNNFYDMINFFSTAGLIAIGVDPAAAAEAGFAAANAESLRSRGLETQFMANLGRGVTVQGEYTYQDAVVTKSFGDPAFGTSFPDIPIGAFSPLKGARPFRRAPHSGSLTLSYAQRKWSAAFTGFLVSRRDDSTFLSDGFFGNTLLLPSRNLAPAYQKFDLSGRYALNSVLSLFTSVENVFSQRYEAAFGFPAAPLTFRSGLKFTIGGEAWGH